MSTGTNSSKRAPQRSGSSSSRKKMSAKKRKAKQRRRIIFFAVEIVALIVLLIAIVGVNMVTKIDKIKINEEDIVVNPQVENNKEMKGYRNIALFGVDSRKGKLGKGSRSDTVMIASINQDTGDVKLVSVYRDTYLNLGTDSYNKANAAYAQGGPEQAINMLNMNFDLDITEYVTVGFDALIETIDELGGVDIAFGGIGINGHLAFNESQDELTPEEFAALHTRVLTISRETRTANAIGDLNGAIDAMPKKAVTIGMAEILGAKKIRLGVFRDWHRSVVRQAAYGEVSAHFPATLIQRHPDAMIIVNANAAKQPF